MTRDTKNSNRWAPGLSPGRIEALTDRTFAIAMTILVLEIPLPILFEIISQGEHTTSFIDMRPDFYLYVMGFLVLGVYIVVTTGSTFSTEAEISNKRNKS